MADPLPVTCTKDQWTLVAQNVVTGMLWRMEKTASYFQTYRMTGGTAPSGTTEAVPIFRDGEPDFEEISGNQAIDVYIYCKVANGKVRVDI